MVTVTTVPSTSYLTVLLERAPLVVVSHVRVAVVAGRRVRLFDHAWADPAYQVEDRPRLVVGAGRARAAERLEPNDRASRLVVDVEVARRVDQFLGRLANRLPVGGENRAGQAVRTGPIAQVERLIELAVCVWVDGEDRPEQLLAQQLEVGVCGFDDRWPDEPPDLVVALPPGDHLRALLLPRELDRVHVVGVRTAVDDRAHEVAEVGHVPLRDRLDQVDEVGLDRLPHGLRDVRARGSRALLPR